MPVDPVTNGTLITEAWGDSVAAAVAALESFATAHPAAADPHTGYQRESEKNAASGYPGLTAAGFVSGNGLAFPAVQVPSADINTLDDYEENSWPPALKFGGNSVGMTYSAAVGFYTKVGRLVTFTFRMILSAKGSSTGNASIVGLPFTPGYGYGASMGYFGGFTGLTGLPIAMIESTGVVCYMSGAAGCSTVTNAHFTNTTDLTISGAYHV